MLGELHQRPLDGARPDPELLGDDPNGQLVVTKSNQLVSVNINTRPTNAGTASSGGGDAGTGSFNEDGLFKLRHRRHQMQEKPAAWGGRVERLVHAGEVDAHCRKFVQGDDHVLQAAKQPVRPEDDENVKVPLPGVEEETIQLGAPLPGPAYAVVHEGIRELPAPALDEGGGLVLLKPRILIQAGNADVPSSSNGVHEVRTFQNRSLSAKKARQPADF